MGERVPVVGSVQHWQSASASAALCCMGNFVEEEQERDLSSIACSLWGSREFAVWLIETAMSKGGGGLRATVGASVAGARWSVQRAPVIFSTGRRVRYCRQSPSPVLDQRYRQKERL